MKINQICYSNPDMLQSSRALVLKVASGEPHGVLEEVLGGPQLNQMDPCGNVTQCNIDFIHNINWVLRDGNAIPVLSLKLKHYC